MLTAAAATALRETIYLCALLGPQQRLTASNQEGAAAEVLLLLVLLLLLLASPCSAATLVSFAMKRNMKQNTSNANTHISTGQRLLATSCNSTAAANKHQQQGEGGDCVVTSKLHAMH
jgi:Flp pilus assembly protein TadG